MIALRWAMLAVAVALALVAFGALAVELPPSALRLTVAALVALLAPLFWPGNAATSLRSALRVVVWSAAAAGLAALALRWVGATAQPVARIGQTCAMLLAILLATHALAALLEAWWRGSAPAAGDAQRARELGGGTAALALALLGALPLWLGPASELLAARHPWAIDAALGASPLTHLAVASGNDLMRNQWFYQHSNLAALPFSYPGPAGLAWGYASVALATGFVALALRLARRAAAARQPSTLEIKP